MGGKTELIAPLSQQALDMGFDGLMIECHCCPVQALSDKEQQLSPAELQQVLNALVVRNRHQPSDELAALRRLIDQCDDELIEVLNRRMELCRQIGNLKKSQNMTVVQTRRYDEILERRMRQAQELGMDPAFMQSVMQVIHEEAVREQVDILRAKK
jgi:chorismate mutase